MGYRTLDKMNQSLLKTILKHPQTFLKTQERYAQKLEDEANGIIEKTPDHFVFGSAVDHMLTEDTDFEEVYYIMKSMKLPSDAIVEVINIVFNEYANEGELAQHTNHILEACARVGYGLSWKPETAVGKVVDAGSDYFLVLQKSANKTVISQEDYQKAIIACAALKTDLYISPFLTKTKDVEIIKKPIFEFTYNGIDFKGEGDMITINHAEKKVYPIDIKTMSGMITDFPGNFWKYRYDFQGAFYSKAVTEYPAVKELLEKGYKLEPFMFFVVEKECINKPMIFTMTHQALQIGTNGGMLTNGKKLEGVKQAVTRYIYHKDSGKWDYPMEYYLNNTMFIEV